MQNTYIAVDGLLRLRFINILRTRYKRIFSYLTANAYILAHVRLRNNCVNKLATRTYKLSFANVVTKITF